MKFFDIRRVISRACLMLVCLVVAGTARAVDNPWNAPTGNWTVAGNWGNVEVPGIAGAADQRPVIDNAGTATINSAVPQVAGLDIGQLLGNTGTLEISGGSLTVVNAAGKTGAGIVNVGIGNAGVAQGTGTLNMTGGTLTAAQLLSANSALNVINLSGNATVNVQSMELSGTVRVTGPNVNLNAPNLVLQGQFVNVIAGITSTTAHSPLKSSATATVGGSLRLDFATGVTPNFGDKWNIIQAKTILGNFVNSGGVPVTVNGVAQTPILGEGYHVRLLPSGADKVLQVSRDKILAIEVNRDSGQINIINPQTGAIQIQSYLISSAVGSLKFANGTWNSLADQLKPNWLEANPTANHIGELNATVGSNLDLGSGTPQTLGNAYDDSAGFAVNGIGASSQDLAFSYSNTAGEVLQGQVTYVGTGKTNSLLLTIDSNGAAILKNDAPGPIVIDSYSILSSGSALLPGVFSESAIAGLSVAGATNSAISELAANPNAPFSLGAGATFNLGNIFNTAMPEEGVSLEFVTSSTSVPSNVVYNGVVRFVDAVAGVLGDYNGNGVVDAADYTKWRDNLGGPATALERRDPTNAANPINLADYNFWKSRFGAITGSGGVSLAGTSVPEPSTGLMLLVMAMVAPVARRLRSSIA